MPTQGHNKRAIAPIQLETALRSSGRTSVALGSALALLCGCVAAKSVTIAPIEINTKLEALDTSLSLKLDLVCYNPKSEDFVFAYFINGTLKQEEDPLYDWKQQQVTQATSSSSICRGELRRIEAPIIMSVSVWPSSEWTHRRNVFLSIVGENALYRISAEGASAKVEVTDQEAARRALPTIIKQSRPSTRGSGQLIDANKKYYRAIHWESTNRVAVDNMRRADDGSIVSMTITIKP